MKEGQNLSYKIEDFIWKNSIATILWMCDLFIYLFIYLFVLSK